MDEQPAAVAEYSRVLVKLLGANSDDLKYLLQGTSLTPETFLSLEGFIYWHDQHRILTNILNWSDIDGLGISATRKLTYLVSHGVVGVAAMSSATILEALEISIRYQSLRSQICNTELLHQDDQVILRLDLGVEMDAVGKFLTESWIGTWASSITMVLGSKLDKVKLLLGFTRPDHVHVYHKYLPFDFQFNQNYTQFSFPRYLTQKPLPTHDSFTKQWALDACEQQFLQFKQQKPFAQRVNALLKNSKGKLPNQDQVASQLNVSVRTLARRLKEEGFTFKKLVDDEQKRLAAHYFNNTKLNIETISDLVGYQDISSFRRAFKRWFHVTPSQYPR